jgi:hypothetical protein
MKNKKMRTWSAARLLLAAAVGLSLFIAMTPTSPEESNGCPGHDHGKLVIRNQSEWFINVDVSGPNVFSRTLDPNQTATVSNVRVGNYKWVAVTTTSIFTRYTQSGSASVKKDSTTTITVTFPGF